MRIIRPAEYKVMPWKNGGGSTIEIYVSSNGADPFNWRVSMATVDADGAFSTFNGYERHIMVMSGAGMALDVEGRGKFSLEPLKPFIFSGDAKVHGSLLNGTVLDLNLMVRRDFGRGLLHVVDRAAGDKIGSEESLYLIHVLQGGCTIGKDQLHPNDSFFLEMGKCIFLSAPLRFAICEITPRLRL